MKKIKRFILSVIFSLGIISCNDEPKYDFTPYEYCAEVYCWKIDGKWYSGALHETSVWKTPEQVQWLQDNLPCPLKTMKKILKKLPLEEGGKRYVFVCIVSVPPVMEELTHDVELIYEKLDTYKWLYRQLGLEFNIDED